MKQFYGNKWLVLVAASLGLFLVVVDSTIVNISIPAMIAGLGTDLPHVEWVLNAYTLVFAALLIPAGRLGDMFGRKRVFMIGLALFGLFSAACGLAPTIGLLIVARILQAVGAAAMMPATLSLVQVSFAPSQRGTAFGIWAALSGFGIGIGPTLGGFLTQYDWRYIFYVNVPDRCRRLRVHGASSCRSLATRTSMPSTGLGRRCGWRLSPRSTTR